MSKFTMRINLIYVIKIVMGGVKYLLGGIFIGVSTIKKQTIISLQKNTDIRLLTNANQPIICAMINNIFLFYLL